MTVGAVWRVCRRLTPERLRALVRATGIGTRIPGLSARGIIEVGPGFGFRFDPGSSNPQYASGRNELPVQRALAEHLTFGGVLYDVGANVGFFTVIAARLVGATGSVYALEPVPANAELVRRNIRLNRLQNVVVIEKAVSDTTGPGELILARYAGGAALSTVAPPPDAVGAVPVEVVSFDDLVQGMRLRPPTVVKIDVEGAERLVLKGMTGTIREHRPVIVYEIDDADPAEFDRKHRACRDLLVALDYQVTDLEPSYPGTSWLVGHCVARPT